jgi:hypothetical protein
MQEKNHFRRPQAEGNRATAGLTFSFQSNTWFGISHARLSRSHFLGLSPRTNRLCASISQFDKWHVLGKGSVKSALGSPSSFLTTHELLWVGHAPKWGTVENQLEVI